MADGAVSREISRVDIREEGWYRIAEITTDLLVSEASRHLTFDYCTAAPLIEINRGWANNGNEIHAVKVILSYGNSKIVPIYDATNYKYIDKIRVSDGSKKASDRLMSIFIDLHYNFNLGNPVKVAIINDTCFSVYNSRLILSKLERVEDNIPNNYNNIFYELKANSWLGSEDSWPLT